MILSAKCTIKKNVPIDGYVAVEGTNLLTLVSDTGDEIASNLSNVLWMGSGSPFPTPPGGPWKTSYNPTHSRFGKCFFVHSDMETEIFIHHAVKKSYGCFIVNPTAKGFEFMQTLIDNRVGMKVVQQGIDDERSAEEKKANQIDYIKIGRVG